MVEKSMRIVNNQELRDISMLGLQLRSNDNIMKYCFTTTLISAKNIFFGGSQLKILRGHRNFSFWSFGILRYPV